MAQSPARLHRPTIPIQIRRRQRSGRSHRRLRPQGALVEGPIRFGKQHLVAMSSTEAELIALADCAGSISVLRRLLGELDLLRPGPTVINEDNISAITVLRDVVYNGRTKHIDIRLKSIRDLVRRSALALEYCQTKDQLADMFTKSLGRDLFQRLRDSVLPQCGATREE